MWGGLYFSLLGPFFHGWRRGVGRPLLSHACFSVRATIASLPARSCACVAAHRSIACHHEQTPAALLTDLHLLKGRHTAARSGPLSHRWSRMTGRRTSRASLRHESSLDDLESSTTTLKSSPDDLELGATTLESSYGDLQFHGEDVAPLSQAIAGDALRWMEIVGFCNLNG